MSICSTVYSFLGLTAGSLVQVSLPSLISSQCCSIQKTLLVAYNRQGPKGVKSLFCHQPPAGLLQPLPAPNRSWSHIALDFVTGLHPSDGHTTILTVVDCSSKAVLLVPLPKLPLAKETAHLLVQHFFWLHGLLSDVSNFWQAYSELLCADAILSSGFHTKSNGRTEWANQLMGMVLRRWASWDRGSWSQQHGLSSPKTPSLRHHRGCRPSTVVKATSHHCCSSILYSDVRSWVEASWIENIFAFLPRRQQCVGLGDWQYQSLYQWSVSRAELQETFSLYTFFSHVHSSTA